MLDRPTPIEILEAVACSLRDDISPKLGQGEAYRLRIMINAIGLVSRQLSYEKGPGPGEEQDRLAHILGAESGESIDALTADLCAQIAAGHIDQGNEELIDHLWQATAKKMEVDQPHYIGYRKAVEMRHR